MNKKLRVAITIVLNGKHHLEHKDFTNFMLTHFDHWIVVEGACRNFGSTKWCGDALPQFHTQFGNSIDGTLEYLLTLSKTNPKLIVICSDKLWNSKDDMFHAAISYLNVLVPSKSCYLWQVDVDEHWKKEQLDFAESEMERTKSDCVRFWCNQYVGKNLLAKGVWGEQGLWWIRLWNWKGQGFKAHEPPELIGGNGKVILLKDIKFDHYSYYFDQDVMFKDLWYGNHRGVYARWKLLQSELNFPQNIQRLIPFADKNGTIVKI